MMSKQAKGRNNGAVVQFSVFTANRLGQLHDVIRLLNSHSIHVLGLTVLDSVESSIIRLVVDDPGDARDLLRQNGFAFNESELLCVEIRGADQLSELMSALLEAELNINFLYGLIPHSLGKPVLALSMEDNEVAEKILSQRAFRLLRQADLSR